MPRQRKVEFARFAQLWIEGVPAVGIAAAFDVSRHTVSDTWRRLALPARYPDGDLRETGLAALSRSIHVLFGLNVAADSVAAAFDVRPALVEDLYRDLRSRARPSGGPSAPASVPGRAIWTRDRDARLLDVRPPGSYRDFARLSDDWGIPMRQVQARWHRVRAGA